MIRDIKYALRALRKNSSQTVIILVILSVAVGANTAVFSAINSIYFQKLPFREADSLVRLQDFTRTPEGAINIYNTWGSHFNAIVAQSKGIECAAAMDDDTLAMERPSGAVKVTVLVQSPGAMECLGVRPVLGRAFTREEENAGPGSGALLVSYAFAEREFGAAGNAVNQTVRLASAPLLIVGVMPKGYRFPYEADAWKPTRISDAVQRDYAVFARLKPNVTLPQLRSELEVIATRIRSEIPGTRPGYGIQAKPLRETLISEVAANGKEKISLTIFVLVFIFLLMACGSVGHLLLARATLRSREFAIQSMLGSPVWRLVRQGVVEITLIVLAGSVLGLALASLGSRFLVTIVPGTLTNEIYGGAINFDWRIVLFNVGSALVIAILCSCLPTLLILKSDLTLQSKAGNRGGTISRNQRRMLAGFVIAETALGFALFAGANGMIVYFNRLVHPQTGFRVDSLLNFQASLSDREYQDPLRRVQLVKEALRRAVQVPGVTAAGVMSTNPLWYGTWGAVVRPQDGPKDADSAVTVNHRLVSPGLLEAMGIPLLRGRTIHVNDSASSPPVVVISDRMARRLFGHDDPLGKRIEWVGQGRPIVTVVGVVDDVQDFGQMRETWYVPYYQQPSQMDALTLHFMVRTAAAPEGAVQPIREMMRSIDPRLPVYEVQTMSSLYDRTIATDRIGSVAASLFAVLGLVLIAMGTYGVLSFIVNATLKEIAIRMALGAPRNQIRRWLVARGLAYVGVGVLVGIVLTEWESRVAVRLVPTLHVNTLSNYFLGTAVLLVIAFLACYYPALRASQRDPIEALRGE